MYLFAHTSTLFLLILWQVERNGGDDGSEGGGGYRG